MSEKGNELESQRLNEGAAQRLIRRATELDATLASESSVADLRTAAREAGISDEAFQRALEEVRTPPLPQKSFGTFAPRRFLGLSVLAMLVGLLLLAVVSRSRVPAPVGDVPTPAAMPTSPTPARPPTPPEAPKGPTTNRPR